MKQWLKRWRQQRAAPRFRNAGDRPRSFAYRSLTAATAGICTPKTLQLGGLDATSSPDDSVATYVGGNMYVGANNQNGGGAYNTLSASPPQKIDKSYAVEAEGLTLVNGKLATNGVKTSWNSKGFRFGVVGFGAQFRPKTGSDALVMAGSATSNIGASTGIMYENSGQKVSAISGFDNGATGRAFVNADANKDPATYTVRINGATSWHFNNPVAGGTNAGRSVWDASKEDNEASTNVSYSSDVNLSSVKNDGTDGDPKDYSNFYNDNVSGLSKQADQPTWLITDCKTGEGKTCTASTGADGKAQTIYDVDPVEGQFKLEGLDWGTYTLEEAKSPDGYNLDSTVRTFAFGPKSDSDGTGNWYSNSIAESNTDKTGTFTTADKTYDSDVFDFAVGGIKNQPGVVLPATGGEGNMKIFAAAIAAAMVAVVAACMALKVRRRQ